MKKNSKVTYDGTEFSEAGPDEGCKKNEQRAGSNTNSMASRTAKRIFHGLIPGFRM